MTLEQFEYRIRDYEGIEVTDNYFLWRKPRVSISDMRKNGKNIRFKSFAEAFEFALDDGRKVADIVGTWRDMPERVLDGEIIWHIKN